jgi:molecular chaperone Hsp33
VARPLLPKQNRSVPDRLCLGVLPDLGLRAVFVRVGETARHGRALHDLAPTSAYLFGQALAAAALFGAVQDEGGRVNLQLVCDGPLYGLLVEAEPGGGLRGWVRDGRVHFAGVPAQAARAALGSKGYLAVRRDEAGGSHRRSLLDLRARSLPEDLRRWFATSQVTAAVADVAVVARGAEPLGDVAGILVERLGGMDEEPISRARERVEGGVLAQALAAGATAQGAISLVAGEGFELLCEVEVAYRCSCSPARVRVAVSALGREGIADVLAKEGEAAVTCEFCRKRYVVGAAELEEIARQLAALG